MYRRIHASNEKFKCWPGILVQHDTIIVLLVRTVWFSLKMILYCHLPFAILVKPFLICLVNLHDVWLIFCCYCGCRWHSRGFSTNYLNIHILMNSVFLFEWKPTIVSALKREKHQTKKSPNHEAATSKNISHLDFESRARSAPFEYSLNLYPFGSSLFRTQKHSNLHTQHKETHTCFIFVSIFFIAFFYSSVFNLNESALF